MTKAERRLYLEYCRNIDEQNEIELEKYRSKKLEWESPYQEQWERFDSAPWFRKMFMLPPTPTWPFYFPFSLENPDLEGFWRWLAEKEADGSNS